MSQRLWWRCYAANRAADARPGRPRAHRRPPTARALAQSPWPPCGHRNSLITPGGWQAAVRHDTVVSQRRRRHATAASSDFFCVPFGGGAPTGASLHLRRPLRRRRPGAEYADCIYGSDCADCGPRVPAAAPMAICMQGLHDRNALVRLGRRIATAAALAPSTWVASSAPTAPNADRASRPPPPICAETCNWASDAD